MESSIILDSRAYYIQKWGNAATIALLDPSCRIFTIPTVDGVIPYKIHLNCAVVFGDPACSPDDMPELIDAFHTYCKAQRKRVVYVVASEQFVTWAFKNYRCSTLEIGHEIILDPLYDPKARSGPHANLLRRKYNHSIREGITVKEYMGNDALLEKAMEQVAVDWLKARSGPQVYISRIEVFSYRANKRWFYAEHAGKIIGVMIMNRIDARNGWVVHVLLVTPEAPKTTSEFIVLCALDVLRAERCRFFSIGPLPGEQLGKIEGLGLFSTILARKIYKASIKVFKLSDRQRYWKKFQPQLQPSFVLFNHPSVRLKEVCAIMRAYNAPF